MWVKRVANQHQIAEWFMSFVIDNEIFLCFVFASFLMLTWDLDKCTLNNISLQDNKEPLTPTQLSASGDYSR